jgi:hypothetical protein
MSDFGADKSGITLRGGKLVLPLAAFGTLVGGLIWVGTIITDAKWRIANVERQQDGIEKQLQQLPTKSDLLQVRLELQEVRTEATEAARTAARRRPRP